MCTYDKITYKTGYEADNGLYTEIYDKTSADNADCSGLDQ